MIKLDVPSSSYLRLINEKFEKTTWVEKLFSNSISLWMFCFDIQPTFGYSFLLISVHWTPAYDIILISDHVSMGMLST